MIELVAATANPHKLAEITHILGERVRVLPRPADIAEVVEDGDTLTANARLKARAIATATGRAAIADDTGLEVDALDGAPGVHSARYAGAHSTDVDNVNKLLAELAAKPSASRRARFRTVVVVRWPDGRELVADGEVAGHIAGRPRGERGFGYDPLFVADVAGGLTFAEMSEADKNAVSHRRRALEALLYAMEDESWAH